MPTLVPPSRAPSPPAPPSPPAEPPIVPTPDPGGIPPTGGRVLVAYGSRFGNTQRVAEALARGLRRTPGVEVECRPIEEVTGEMVRRAGLLAIGGPTEIFSAARPMKQFLSRIPPGDVRGKRGFAFETRVDAPLAGSAGRFIEHWFTRNEVVLLRRRATARVRGMTPSERAVYGHEGAPAWAKPRHAAPASPPGPLDLLFPGTEAEFEEIGIKLGGSVPVPVVPVPVP